MKTSNTIFTKACMVLAATALVNVGCTDVNIAFIAG